MLGVFADVDPEVIEDLDVLSARVDKLEEQARPVYVNLSWSDALVWSTCMDNLDHPLVAVEGGRQGQIALSCERDEEDEVVALLLAFAQAGAERRLFIRRIRREDGGWDYERDDGKLEYYAP